MPPVSEAAVLAITSGGRGFERERAAAEKCRGVGDIQLRTTAQTLHEIGVGDTEPAE